MEAELESLHPAAFAWAMTCCCFDREEAADVLQSAYLKVLDGRARFDGQSSVKTWLFSVIRRTAADRRRRRWFRSLGLARLFEQPAVAAPPAPDEELAVARRRARVRSHLAALPARQREVLDLVFYAGCSVEEAAEAMGVSVGTARVHYDRAKRALLARLDAEGLP